VCCHADGKEASVPSSQTAAAASASEDVDHDHDMPTLYSSDLHSQIDSQFKKQQQQQQGKARHSVTAEEPALAADGEEDEVAEVEKTTRPVQDGKQAKKGSAAADHGDGMLMFVCACA